MTHNKVANIKKALLNRKESVGDDGKKSTTVDEIKTILGKRGREF